MGTASPNVDLTSAASSDVPPTGLGRAIDVTSRLATSWLGLLTAYVGAVTAAFIGFQKLPDPLKSSPLLLRVALLAALPVLALVFHTIPTLVERRRRKQLTDGVLLPTSG